MAVKNICKVGEVNNTFSFITNHNIHNLVWKPFPIEQQDNDLEFKY